MASVRPALIKEGWSEEDGFVKGCAVDYSHQLPVLQTFCGRENHDSLLGAGL